MSVGRVHDGLPEITAAMSIPVPHGTYDEIMAMIQNGILKEGDNCIIDDDYDDRYGTKDISAIGDGTLTGAIVQNSNDIINLQTIGSLVDKTTKNYRGQSFNDLVRLEAGSYIIDISYWSTVGMILCKNNDFQQEFRDLGTTGGMILVNLSTSTTLQLYVNTDDTSNYAFSRFFVNYIKIK